MLRSCETNSTEVCHPTREKKTKKMEETNFVCQMHKFLLQCEVSRRTFFQLQQEENELINFLPHFKV